MENENELKLVELLDSLAVLLNKYEGQTNQMVSADLGIIQDVLLSRNDTIEEMRQVKQRINEEVVLFPEDEQEVLKSILSGRASNNDELSPFQKQVQVKMHSLHTLQQNILSKDFQITARIKNNFEEIKKELEALKQDKKRIDYYSSASTGDKGGSFDSHM